MKKILCCVSVVLQFTFTFILSAQNLPENSNPVVDEMERTKALHQAVRRDDATAVEAALMAPAHSKLKFAKSAAIARRTADVCGWLWNESDYARATQLARAGIEKVARLGESKSEDRLERLYWEAWLEAEILNRRDRAAELLNLAAAIDPADERVAALQLRVLAAVAAARR